MDSVGILPTNLSSMIWIQPKRGTLASVDKPTTVQVFFRARKEVKVESQPILRCQVRELRALLTCILMGTKRRMKGG